MPKGQKRKQKDTNIIDLSGDDLDTGAKPKSAVKRRQKSSKGQAEKRVNAQGLAFAAHVCIIIVYHELRISCGVFCNREASHR